MKLRHPPQRLTVASQPTVVAILGFVVPKEVLANDDRKYYAIVRDDANDVQDEDPVVTLPRFANVVATVVDEIHFMRKIVIDGSNTGGFQRTALIAIGGKIDDVGIQIIALEEDAARKIEEKGRIVNYGLDRLGIPLIEIATPVLFSIKLPLETIASTTPPPIVPRPIIPILTFFISLLTGAIWRGHTCFKHRVNAPGVSPMVGTAGFEPAAPCPPDKYATRLRYVPTYS